MVNNFLYYKEFKRLNESLSHEDDVQIIVLSNLNVKSYTVDSIRSYCKKKGVKCFIFDIDTTSIEESNNEKYDLYISDSEQKRIGINTNNTAFLTRRGVVRSTYTRDIVEQIEDKGFFVVNSLSSMMTCENKYITSKLLGESGIKIPKMAIVENEDGISSAIDKIGGKFPVILKLLSGTQGIGVSIIESEASLKSVLQTIWKLNPGAEVLIQEKIESDHDLRIHVLTKKFNSPNPDKTDSVLLGYMRRNKIDKDFRTNHSLGGTVEKTKVTKEQESISLECAKIIGCNWAAVDIIVDKKTGDSYVLEVNASPGTQGLKKATGVDVIGDIIEFLLDKNNWIRNKMTIGFREVLHVKGIGDFVAKFDTGNGSVASSITYDKKEISEDQTSVEWSLGNKKFKSEIVGWANTEVGTETHTRPIILMDIEFRGKVYKDVHVALVDRSDKSTKFLVNRRLMERIGCTVSPNKTFVVTGFDGKYDAMKSKEKKHAGIKFRTDSN